MMEHEHFVCAEVQSSFEAKTERRRRRDAHKTIIKMTSASNHSSAGEQVFTANAQCYSSRVFRVLPQIAT